MTGRITIGGISVVFKVIFTVVCVSFLWWWVLDIHGIREWTTRGKLIGAGTIPIVDVLFFHLFFMGV